MLKRLGKEISFNLSMCLTELGMEQHNTHLKSPLCMHDINNLLYFIIVVDLYCSMHGNLMQILMTCACQYDVDDHKLLLNI